MDDPRDRTQKLFDEIWPTPAPSAGFAQRVLRAQPKPAGTVGPLPAPRLPRRSAAGAAALVLVFAATLGLGAWGLGHLPGSSGHLLATTRQTVNLAGRAVAVIEPGAELTWTVRGVGELGDIRIDHSHGSVFYRVEHGGRFTVVTPGGAVAVTGTCFRVVMDSAPSAATAALVEVLEGAVRVHNGARELALPAGQSAQLSEGRPPELLGAAGAGQSAAALPDLLARLHRTTSRAERAEARLRALEQRGDAEAHPLRPRSFDESGEQRRLLARHCKFRWSLPDHLTTWSNPDGNGAVAMTADERAAVAQVMEDQRTQFVASLRAIYGEIVGNPLLVETLSPMSLFHEIDAKSRRQDGVDARRLILQEWAGDVPAPPEASFATRPTVERFWRLLVGAQDDFFHQLAAILGGDRAAQVVRLASDSVVMGDEPGCPSGQGR